MLRKQDADSRVQVLNAAETRGEMLKIRFSPYLFREATACPMKRRIMFQTRNPVGPAHSEETPREHKSFRERDFSGARD